MKVYVHHRRVVSLALTGWLALAGAASGTDLDHILFQTIRRGDTESLRSLLRQGTPVDIRTPDGTTPLLYAALRGNLESVRLLLEHGADPNAANRIGATPLLWGASEPDKVRTLLEHGASPHERSALGNTPLLAAAAGAESSRSVELLLAAGADVEAINRSDSTALANAAISGSPASVRALLEHGARTKTQGRASRRTSALLAAANRGNREIVELLLEHGADPNASEPGFAGSALNLALLRQKPEIAELIIAKGGGVNAPTPVGAVPPMVLAAYTEAGDTTIARLMLERGADVNAANARGETVLTWARRRGHEELISMLRNAGATEPESARKTKALPGRSIRLHAGNQDSVLKEAIGKSLNLLALSSDAFLRNRESCVSCHHQNLPGVAMAWARDRGFEIDQGAIDRMVERQVRSWRHRIDNAYELDRPVPVPPRFLGWGFLGFSALGYPRDDVTDAMVWYLAAIQQADGHWIPGALRPPLGGDEIVATTLALRALQLYPLEGRESQLAARVAKARKWLLAARPRFHQERVFKLLGLAWTGSSTGDLEEQVGTILNDQREDGGWAQLAGMTSDAWATGQSLVALATAGGLSTSHPAYRRGLEFLLSTRFDDGSWFVESRAWPFQPHFDSRFPHGRDQWISAPATAWAVMALILAVRPFDQVVIAGASSGTTERDQDTPSAASAATREAKSLEAEAPSASTTPVDFAQAIQPVLERSCVGCHAGEKPKANFRLTTRSFLLKGGESGEAAIVPGRGDESLLVRLVSGQVEDLEMPPLRSRKRYAALTSAEIQSIRAWIDQQAPWPSGVVLEARSTTGAAEAAATGSYDREASNTAAPESRAERFTP